MRIYIIFLFVIVSSNYSLSQIHRIIYGDSIYMQLCKYAYCWELKDSLEDGIWLVMYKSNKKCKDDNLYIIGTYKNYKKHGEFLRYSIDSGMHYVLEIENYTIGVLDGLYIKWKSFKERDIEGEYISGKREGKWVLYKENLKYIIYYKNDIAQEWKCIDENGNIIKKGNGCPDFLKTFINP